MLKLLDLLVRLLTTVFTTKGPQEPQEPVWLRKARREIGFHETGVNLGIERYIEAAKCGALGAPYCAIFANAMLETSSVRGTRSAMARSFEHDEDYVKLAGPAVGAITTMWRQSRNSGLGHVFFYTGHDENGRVWGVGANEDDAVRLVPHDPSRIVGYYWPKSIPLPKIINAALLNSKGVSISTKEV